MKPHPDRADGPVVQEPAAGHEGSARPLATERRAHLLRQVEAAGTVRTRALAVELGVTEMTVARDLRQLADAGLCQRVYGGAVSLSVALPPHPRRLRFDDGLQVAANKAASLIGAGLRVVLDGGAAMVTIAHQLPHDLSCTVITRSPAVAQVLTSHRHVTVELIGGPISPVSGQSGGAAAAEQAATIDADLMLLSVDGVHLSHGLTAADDEDAVLKRLLISRAAQAYVVMTSTQFGTAAPHRVVRITGVTGLITDRLLPGAVRLTEEQRIRVV